MRSGSILAAILGTLLLGGPVMACLMPTAQLSAEERQCCEEMAGECHKTDSDKPASHSCCTMVVQPHKDFLPSVSVAFSSPQLEFTALIIPSAVPEIESFSRSVFSSKLIHGPPDQTLSASSPLRI